LSHHFTLPAAGQMWELIWSVLGADHPLLRRLARGGPAPAEFGWEHWLPFALFDRTAVTYDLRQDERGRWQSQERWSPDPVCAALGEAFQHIAGCVIDGDTLWLRERSGSVLPEEWEGADAGSDPVDPPARRPAGPRTPPWPAGWAATPNGRGSRQRSRCGRWFADRLERFEAAAERSVTAGPTDRGAVEAGLAEALAGWGVTPLEVVWARSPYEMYEVVRDLPWREKAQAWWRRWPWEAERVAGYWPAAWQRRGAGDWAGLPWKWRWLDDWDIQVGGRPFAGQALDGAAAAVWVRGVALASDYPRRAAMAARDATLGRWEELRAQDRLVEALSGVTRVCGGPVAGGGVTLVCCERPVVATGERTDWAWGDPQSLPHGAAGPAVVWPDGNEEFYWHGWNVPRAFYGWTAAEALGLTNLEQRRLAIERIGWVELADELELVDVAPDPGNPGQILSLYDVPPEFRAASERLLIVANASLDRDGSRRCFALFTPSEIDDPVEAAARLFGLERDEYAALQRAC